MLMVSHEHAASPSNNCGAGNSNRVKMMHSIFAALVDDACIDTVEIKV